MTDFYAQSAKRDGVVTNIGELLRNNDKISAMRLLGCEKKYTDGACSDYEFFAEWERVAPLCAGTGISSVYQEERTLLGLAETDPTVEQWRRGNECLESHCSEILKVEREPSVYDLNKIVSDFVKYDKGASLKYDDIRESFGNILCAEKSNTVHVTISLKSNKFQRPDPYHAALFWEKKNVEKWNTENESVLLVQLLIDGLLTIKKHKKDAVLHLYAKEDEVADATLSYLLDRSLTEGQIRLGISTYCDPDSLVCRMERWSGERVIPELVLGASDLDEGLEERLYGLFCLYPVGGLRFGGVLTDALLLDAYHNSFDRRFRNVLARLSANPSAMEQITERFYSAW